jgi:hypothetical protein
MKTHEEIKKNIHQQRYTYLKKHQIEHHIRVLPY